jgi:hypothetical protein
MRSKKGLGAVVSFILVDSLKLGKTAVARGCTIFIFVLYG